MRVQRESDPGVSVADLECGERVRWHGEWWRVALVRRTAGEIGLRLWDAGVGPHDVMVPRDAIHELEPETGPYYVFGGAKPGDTERLRLVIGDATVPDGEPWVRLSRHEAKWLVRKLARHLDAR